MQGILPYLISGISVGGQYALIAIGYTLDEITNDVTGKTCACFEPALDYIVVKYPKWPFDKFVYADKSLGTQMMATGEVMAIGNNFEHAMMKAVSSIELGMDTLTHKPFEELTDEEVVEHMHVQDAERVFCVYEALKRGIDHKVIYDITKIDWWFLDKMQHLADLEKGLAKCNGVLSLVSSLLFETQAPLSVWTPNFIGVMAFLSVGCTCVALLIQNVGLAHVPASTGSLLLSMESPSGVLFSVLLMGEALTSRLLAGFVLIFLSIILSETHFDFLRKKPRPQL